MAVTDGRPGPITSGSTISVSFSSSSSSLQPVIDQILAEMQQAVAYDSALPYATPDSSAQLPTILQNTEFQLLQILLAR
jgi:hypothetical protein